MVLANTQIVTFDQWIASFFNNLKTQSGWSYGNLICGILAVIICIVLCGIIGYEREKRGSSAGLRTHLLVGVGSCLVMFISIYGFPQDVGNRDVARLAAQAVTGVGFLGAGTIIHNNRGVKGLTTASTIWLSMAIGLACGSFNFTLAIFSTLAVMFVLIILFKLEVRMYQRRPRFDVIADCSCPLQSEVLKIALSKNFLIKDLESKIINNDKECLVEINFAVVNEKGNKNVDADAFKEEIEKINGIKTVEIKNK